MKVGIIGLGLIGGSLGRAIVKKTDCTVYAFDIDNHALIEGKLLNAYHYALTKENIKEMDMLFFSLYPEALEKSLEEFCPLLKNGALVLDCCGNKRRVVSQMKDLSKKYPNLDFISAHPMAGREFSGISHSTSTLFDKASMILVPVKAELKRIKEVKEFSLSLGFGSVVISTADNHDKIIAFTSQLAHLVSSSYIKSPTASEFMGFSAGSFRDMTRVARLNEKLWTELFFDNRDNLLTEISGLIERLTEYKNALEDNDKDMMTQLLQEGTKCKLLSEKKYENNKG